MPYKDHVLLSTLVLLLLNKSTLAVKTSTEPELADQTLGAIRECMSKSPSPWPDEWKKEYLETIRSVVELNHAAHYRTRLEILGNGFETYWRNIEKSNERSLFLAQQAQIRWYIENLMGTELPTDKERQKLRDQYKNLLDHAANSLLKQFAFLDPNDVQAAKADELSTCYRRINVPFMPVYLQPMSEEQVDRIKKRWDKLRYARVDIWRRLSSRLTTPEQNSNASSSNLELDYELTKKSISQLLGQIWIVASVRPDYYISALKNNSRAIQNLLKSKQQTWNNESRLEKTRSKQLLQTEHIGFLLSALLETPLHLDRSASLSTQEQIP